MLVKLVVRGRVELPTFRFQVNLTVAGCRWTSPDKPSDLHDCRGASPGVAGRLPALAPPVPPVPVPGRVDGKLLGRAARAGADQTGQDLLAWSAWPMPLVCGRGWPRRPGESA